MNEINKNELSDDMLENVSGGTGEGDMFYEEWNEGDRFILVNPKICSFCGKTSDTGRIRSLTYREGGKFDLKVVMDCCGKFGQRVAVKPVPVSDYIRRI